jgi:hypothetical protein
MVSVFHGPWLLGVDEAGSPGFFDEPFTENSVKLAPGDVKLEPAAPTASAAPISVPVAHFRLTYFPGGYPMQPAQAVLRPIAEATSSADQNQWAFWLPCGIEGRVEIRKAGLSPGCRPAGKLKHAPHGF